MKADPFFARHPVFTRAEFAAACAASGSTGERTPDALLAYHTKEGRLLRVRRGLYAVVPKGADPATVPLDAFLLATHMTDDAVVAYHSALELHGVAYSTTDRLLYLTLHEDTRPVTFRTMAFRPVLVPKSLREQGEQSFGVTVVDRSGLDVRVTTLERTLVDVLDRLDLGGGWEEAWRSLEAVSFFDLAQVVDYAVLLGNATTVSKVGFFLEQHQEALSVTEEHLRRLGAYAPVGTHYAKRSSRGTNVFLRKWNLVVPEAVARRAWEEVV